jgi:hypothetical protein
MSTTRRSGKDTTRPRTASYSAWNTWPMVCRSDSEGVSAWACPARSASAAGRSGRGLAVCRGQDGNRAPCCRLPAAGSACAKDHEVPSNTRVHPLVCGGRPADRHLFHSRLSASKRKTTAALNGATVAVIVAHRSRPCNVLPYWSVLLSVMRGGEVLGADSTYAEPHGRAATPDTEDQGKARRAGAEVETA